MSKSNYVTMHGGLKVSAELAEKLKLDPRNPIAAAGTVLELDDDFVKQVDPAGVQFVSEEQYAALVEKVEANDAAESAIAKLQSQVASAAQKLATERVNAKLVLAVRAIEAAKKAPKKGGVKAAPAEEVVTAPAKPAAKKAPKKGGA